MPKKYRRSYNTKPATSAHPSLSSSDPRNGGGKEAAEASRSGVNELIQHLRRAQAKPAAAGHQTAPEVLLPAPAYPSPTSPAEPSLAQAAPPRQQMALRRRNRRLAGPPAPLSWAVDSLPQPKRDDASMDHRPVLRTLPAQRLPTPASLLDMSLKELARNWSLHVHEDGEYLSVLPPQHKQALLAYLAVYSPVFVTRRDIELLFLDEGEFPGGTGSDTITHLVLSRMLHSEKSYGEILALFDNDFSVLSSGPIPESWDESSDRSREAAGGVSPVHVPTVRFPALTHLSLACAPSPSWRGLLSIAPRLDHLTHLSLAYWPAPSLTPNSTTASVATPAGRVSYGASSFYSASDGDWSEAAGVLRRLGKSLLRLKWLDLEGCSGVKGWIEALSWNCAGGSDAGRGVDWDGAWRGLDTLKAGQGSVPRALKLANEDEYIDKVVTWLLTNSVNANTRIRLKEIYGATGWTESDAIDASGWIAAEQRVRKVGRTIGAARRESGLPALRVLGTEVADWVDRAVDNAQTKVRSLAFAADIFLLTRYQFEVGQVRAEAIRRKERTLTIPGDGT